MGVPFTLALSPLSTPSSSSSDRKHSTFPPMLTPIVDMAEVTRPKIPQARKPRIKMTHAHITARMPGLAMRSALSSSSGLRILSMAF